ncbi:hypothetical protein F5X68DRAFT_213269 [Plectosphaerella plurivora]|uniref:Uncharacterized protein n=1 Tax=Plectosphaerella plurivora TaxID=936078 RepID=A0A9P8V5S6_9PEZI|nr:hypothetical protein F5X68DRAFT_213269 [Plectosphaerella plurivora]
MPQFTATFVPGGIDDYYMPEVIAPSPQRVTPQVPQNMQGDVERMELEADLPKSQSTTNTNAPAAYTGFPQRQSSLAGAPKDAPRGGDSADNFSPYQAKPTTMSRSSDAPSFSPFPKVKGENIPPSDEEKEEILWNAREHVLHSNNVSMQLSWARDTLAWVETVQEAAVRELNGQPRPPTPKVEHSLKKDAVSIVTYLSEQDHPEALFMRSKWLEFGKFELRQDRKEAFSGYKRAAALGYPRAEYRMGMLFEASNDYGAAIEHYYSGLRQKDSAASYRLGMMSLLGQHGQIKDYQRGLKLIQDAADSADEDAPQGAYVYGMLLARELPEISIPEAILPPDLALSKMYLEKAAYLGFAKAQLKMGQAYELCQLSCDFNPAYSIHYYGLAAKQGQPEAALGVSRWFLFGYEGIFNKNEQLAFKYAKEAADAKLATGEFAMGYYHEIGIHVPKDLRQAKVWYELAADHGNKDALGRLDSLKDSKSLTKADHETTTLTRIKSTHGSQRGKRPDRFKQPAQAMPTLDEGAAGAGSSPGPSPQPSPGVRPTVVQDGLDYPDPSRASIHTSRPAFSVNLDTANLAVRPKSAAPYPVDDRPAPLNYRPQSTAPYPEDDMGRLAVRNSLGPQPGPQADRPGSAFGIRPTSQGDYGGGRTPYGGGLTGSQSMGNLVPANNDPRGRPPMAGGGGYRQPSPGIGGPGRMDAGRPATTQPYPSGPGPSNPAVNKLSKPGPNAYGRPQSSGPGPAPGPGQGPSPGQGYGSQPPAQPGRDYGPRTSSRPTPTPAGQPTRYDSPASSTGSRVSSLQNRPPTGPGPSATPRPSNFEQAGRVGSAPPAPQPGPPKPQGPPKPTKAPSGQGPATFEEMGIPQGKGDDQCSLM